MLTFTERLNRALRQAGISAMQLAQLAGIDRRVIAELVNGRRELLDDLHGRRIANLLGVSIHWLLTGEPSRAAAEAIATFRSRPEFARITERDQQTMIEFLETLPAADELEIFPTSDVEKGPVLAANLDHQGGLL